jgi:hypothetical protein
MGSRSALQQEVVDALIASKAVDFEAVGGILGKYGSRVAREGDDFYVVIHRFFIDACIPADPFGVLRVRDVLAERAALEAGELKR